MSSSPVYSRNQEARFLQCNATPMYSPWLEGPICSLHGSKGRSSFQVSAPQVIARNAHWLYELLFSKRCSLLFITSEWLRKSPQPMVFLHLASIQIISGTLEYLIDWLKDYYLSDWQQRIVMRGASSSAARTITVCH